MAITSDTFQSGLQTAVLQSIETELRAEAAKQLEAVKHALDSKLDEMLAKVVITLSTHVNFETQGNHLIITVYKPDGL